MNFIKRSTAGNTEMKARDKVMISWCVNTIIRLLIFIAKGVYENKEARGLAEIIKAYDDLYESLVKWSEE